MEKVEPDNFNVKYGGFGRISWQVRWEGGQVVWRRFAPEWTEVATEEVKPEPQQWVDFWSALDESRIWDWNEVYYRSADRIDVPDGDEGKDETDNPPEDTDDVISWSVEILLKDGRLVDSSGSNAVPGETRRSRRGRGRGRNRRHQQSTAKDQTTGSGTDVADSAAVTSEPIDDGNNSGIPDDTFHRFLQALRALLGGREFADDDGELIPEALPTQFRARTAERKDRPDPFAEEEKKSSPQRSRSKKRVRSSRSRSVSSSAPRGGGGTSQRKRPRRGGKKRTGETVSSTTGAAGDAPNPARKRRRRRRKPNPAGEKPQEGQASLQDPAPQGDGTRRKRKRRRRRSRKPGGGEAGGGGESSGGTTPT